MYDFYGSYGLSDRSKLQKKKNIPLPLQCDTNHHDNHKSPTNYCNNALLLNQSQQEREPWANIKGKKKVEEISQDEREKIWEE